MSKKKITVSVSKELYSWCSEISESMGISVPSMFVFAMYQYKQQQESINAMGNVDEIVKKLESLKLSDINKDS